MRGWEGTLADFLLTLLGDRNELSLDADSLDGRLATSQTQRRWTITMDDKKYFTVEEANRLIPQMKAIIEQLRQGRRHLLRHRPTAEAVAQKGGGNGGGSEAGAYLSDYSQTLGRALAQLQTMGVLLKDLERGLIDFPHWREGREVYLCWKYDEERIDYWHETDSGYSGRQPL